MSFQLQFKQYSSSQFTPGIKLGLDREIFIEKTPDNKRFLRIISETGEAVPLSINTANFNDLIQDTASNGGALSNLLDLKSDIGHTHTSNEIFHNTESLADALTRLDALDPSTVIRNNVNHQQISSPNTARTTFNIGLTSASSALLRLGPTHSNLDAGHLSPFYISEFRLRASRSNDDVLTEFGIGTALGSDNRNRLALTHFTSLTPLHSELLILYDDGIVEIPNLHVKVDNEYKPIEELASGRIKQEVPNHINGDTYELTEIPKEGTLMLFVNGVYQPTSSYTLSDNLLSLSSVPANASIAVFYFY